MKKTFLTLLIAVAIVASIPFTLQAKDFKGIITYKISIEGTEVTPEMQAFMPKVMTYTIKGSMAKTEINMNMMKQTQIIDGDKKMVYSLFDMMGQKFYTKSTEEELDEKMETSSEPTVEFINETKEIAGYTCKKAIVTDEQDGKKISYIVYYAPELGSQALNFDNPLFKDIDGLLMEFEINEGGMKMKFEAIEVQKKNVSDSEFEIPEGYQEKSQDEIMNNFGG